MREKLNASGMATDVDTDYQVGMPELRIVPDRARAADLGVSVEDVATTVNALVGGVRVGKYTTGGRRIDVRMRLLAAQRTRPEDLSRLRVRTADGDAGAAVVAGEGRRAAGAAGGHPPRPRARHHDLRQRRAGQLAGRGARVRRAISKDLPAGLPGRARRIVGGVPGVDGPAHLRPVPGHHGRVHGAGVAVQLVPAPGDACSPSCRCRSPARRSRC